MPLRFELRCNSSVRRNNRNYSSSLGCLSTEGTQGFKIRENSQLFAIVVSENPKRNQKMLLKSR